MNANRSVEGPHEEAVAAEALGCRQDVIDIIDLLVEVDLLHGLKCQAPQCILRRAPFGPPGTRRDALQLVHVADGWSGLRVVHAACRLSMTRKREAQPDKVLVRGGFKLGDRVIGPRGHKGVIKHFPVGKKDDRAAVQYDGQATRDLEWVTELRREGT